MPSNFGDIAV